MADLKRFLTPKQRQFESFGLKITGKSVLRESDKMHR
jgi:hypothetical protein